MFGLSNMKLLKVCAVGDRAALWSVAVSPRGDWLAAAGQTGVVFLWAVPSTRPQSSGNPQPRRNCASNNESTGTPLSASETPRPLHVDGGQRNIHNSAKNGNLHDLPVNTKEMSNKFPDISLQQEAPTQAHSCNLYRKVLDSSSAAAVEASSSLTSTSDLHSAVRGQMLTKPLQPWFIGDKPDMCLTGHGASVIFLSWAPSVKMSLLLSASLDRTVRLWRPSRQAQAIAIIRCTDWPTSASFHPIFKVWLLTQVTVRPLEATIAASTNGLAVTTCTCFASLKGCHLLCFTGCHIHGVPRCYNSSLASHPSSRRREPKVPGCFVFGIASTWCGASI